MEQKMQSIHKFVKVVNNQVIIDLPPGFADCEVEVFLKPPSHKDMRVLELEKEIDVGMKSQVSPRSHREIFDRLREKYESC
jgi:hypothetical protein